MLECVVRSRPRDLLADIRKICDTFDSVPTVRKAVGAARKRARELQAERAGAVKKRRPKKQ
jgi:hypothetical protein